MFQTAEGVSIPFPDKMQEQYQLYDHCVRFLLSFEKIKPMLLDFINQSEEPLFKNTAKSFSMTAFPNLP